MHKQQGTILIIFLGWLAVLCIIGIGSLKQSLGMGQTSQAQHLALHTFEAAEAAMVAAQQVVVSWDHDPPTACAQVCVVAAETVDFYPRQPNAWWEAQENGAVISIPWIDAIQPYYVIEYLTTHLDEGSDVAQQFFRITAKALASHKQSATVLQLTVVKSVKNRDNSANKQKVLSELTTIKGDVTPVIRQAWRQYY